jgi:chromosome segregation ATPase
MLSFSPGGERSFSTLCFTLSLHGMTEAPFRAMDEFDVFMVSNHLTFAIIFAHLITEQTW